MRWCCNTRTPSRSPGHLSLPLDKESGGLALSIISSYRQILLRISFGALWLIASVGAVTLFPSTDALATTAVPRCSASQLTMSIFDAGAVYNTAGNHGAAFIFRNISKRACSLQGYPTIRFTPDSFKGRSTKFTHSVTMFVAVPPRLVVIKQSDSASFGLNFGDAYNQSPIYDGTSCMTRTASVRLPVRPHPYSIAFTAELKVNFCFADFQFGITSIQSGQVPKRR